jgi:hypothetical protein
LLIKVFYLPETLKIIDEDKQIIDQKKTSQDNKDNSNYFSFIVTARIPQVFKPVDEWPPGAPTYCRGGGTTSFSAGIPRALARGSLF